MKSVLKLATAAFVVALGLQACGADEAMERRSNIKPPAVGIPAAGAEVTGIYRTKHQGLLQLRGDGSLVLILPGGPGPTTGSFTLNDGKLMVRTANCGDASGTYDVEVTGEQKAGKAELRMTAVNDPCADRRDYLAADPWVYANS